MKKYFSIIALFFVTNLTVLSNDTNHCPNNTDPIVEESAVVIKNAFYTNHSNDIIFIDFDNIELTVSKVNIQLNGKIVMEEDVEELPQDMIHEIELTFFEKGEYTVELIIQNGSKIKKKIIID